MSTKWPSSAATTATSSGHGEGAFVSRGRKAQPATYTTQPATRPRGRPTATKPQERARPAAAAPIRPPPTVRAASWIISRRDPRRTWARQGQGAFPHADAREVAGVVRALRVEDVAEPAEQARVPEPLQRAARHVEHRDERDRGQAQGQRGRRQPSPSADRRAE